MRNYFISIEDVSKSEIFEIFELAKLLRKSPHGNQFSHKIFALFFKHPSPWFELTFETGIKQLNGRVINLNPTSVDQLLKEKSLEDMIKTLKKQVDAIIIGNFSHAALKHISKYSDVPIINAVSGLENPCQVLSDLFTIKERFKDFESLKLAYIGNGNNVCNSLLLGCTKVGMDVAIACPAGYEPDKDIIELARNYTKVSKSRIVIGREPKEIVKDANIVYNDIFINIANEKERQKQLKNFIPKYQVTSRLMGFAAPDVVYMHCLPVYRGEEATVDVIDGRKSIVFDQAENKLHTQKALLMKMVGTKKV
jgi:ornithine carbamoyltransferase